MIAKPFAPLLMSAILVGCGPASAADLQPIGTISHRPIREASGLFKSRRHDGVFWTHNDSGNAPHLFAVNRAGKCLAEYRVKGAVNLDWEAITGDDNGNLYIGDIGNNIIPGGLAKRFIYKVKEPVVLAPLQEGAAVPELTAESQYPYTFPDKPFDAEGMFFFDDSVFIISKVKQGSASLYQMPMDKPEQAVSLRRVIEFPKLLWATDASLSKDGRRLAVCSYHYAVFYEMTPTAGIASLKDKPGKVVRFGQTEIEACSWNNDELILIGEDRKIYAIPFKG